MEQDNGIFDAVHSPHEDDAMRPRYLKMDRKTAVLQQLWRGGTEAC